MRKKNLFKKLIAAAGAMAMALTMMMPMGVSAATTPNYPENTEKGSITITKYVDANSSNWTDGGVVQEAPTDKTPLSGVTFTIKRVGGVTQETYSDANTTGILYAVTDNDVKTMMSNESQTAVKTNGATSYYTSTALDVALKTAFGKDETIADDIVEGSNLTCVTDSNGKAKFESLEQGLYLVAETAVPADVTKRSVPFFVAIPSYVAATSTAAGWELNVNAYPKNSTSDTVINKIISNVTNNSTPSQIASNLESAQATIGDVITYQVPVTAVIPDTGLTKLDIIDTMSKGLTFVTADTSGTVADTDVKVYKGESATGTPLNDSCYDVTKSVDEETGVTTLNVSFTGDYILTLNNGNDSTPKFVFEYSARLNSDAVVGTVGNENSVKLVYNYNNNPNTMDETTPPETTKVYTWGIDITKHGELSDPLQGVKFNLIKDTENGTPITFAQDDETGVYTVDATGVEALTTNASGKICVKGLESGTYYLKEISTQSGYVLLKDPIAIVIKGNSSDGMATATVGGETVTMTQDGNSESAFVPLTVVNNKGFDLPQTGAAGTALFAVAGMAIAAVAGGLLFFLRRSSKK